jgi:hypothetical protein
MEKQTMPLNRFITFIKPYLNLLAGAIAAWLIAKANVLGIPGLGEHGNDLQIAIAAALTWGVTQIVTEIGDLKWLKGHHLSMIGEADIQAATLQAPQPALSSASLDLEEELIESDEDLPDDDDELAAPPPDDTNMPIQPSQSKVDGVPA